MSTIKVGMVGLDTSHCPAFAKLLNNPEVAGYVPGCQVVRAFPGGSELFSSSINRVEGFTKQFKDEFGIEIAGSLEELADGMDAFMLESVDGRQHLEQFKVLAEYGKPVFIDKPLACCYDDAVEIFKIAKEKNVPVMTSSSLRYAMGIADALEANEHVQACHAFGPMSILEDYRDYFWYGIHSTEVLFSLMGTGCKEVHSVVGKDYDLLVGVWEDGRIGTVTGKRVEPYNFGCSLLTDKGEKTTVATTDIPWYNLMIGPIVDFYQTGKSPITDAESLEIIAFLEAASRSRAANGAIIALNSL